MSEYATFLKIGATSVLLTILEDKGQILRDLTLENPIRAIREISQDITLKAKVRLANGREVSALEIQTEYLEKALKYRDSKGLAPDQDRALDMWADVVDQLWKDPSVLADRCDWVAKHQLIEEYSTSRALPLGHPKLAMIDLLYHDVDRSRGLYYRLERGGRMARITTDEKIATAQVSPPQTTRARLRGDFVKRAKERRRDYTVDWVHLKLNDQAQRTVILKDPFVSHDDRVERLIASL
jgi:proteasome accessory factor A